MNEQLESRWRQSEAPFDGQVMHLHPGSVELGIVRTALRLLSDLLRPVNGEICINEDWHDHDGFKKPSQPFSWEAFDGWLASDEALASHQQGDVAVYWAVHDLDHRFLLRFYLDDEQPASECHLDLCGADSVLHSAATRLAEEGIATRIGPAKAYFDQRYGG
ncbi:MAG: hypothetical protein JJ863_24610 [Deltaproteobacteria bacterium]|nr:hypothetical protein [Deltaproteobacteria bacterium]